MSKPHEFTINKVADYFIAENCTVRSCARHFAISKSTIHNYLTKYLPKIDPIKYRKVSLILRLNFSEKHIRGGHATKLKFKKNIHVDDQQGTIL